ncbi:MAG: right-handed parallel beta-helix repeat-containing protein [Pseudomonadota bacterium]
MVSQFQLEVTSPPLTRRALLWSLGAGLTGAFASAPSAWAQSGAQPSTNYDIRSPIYVSPLGQDGPGRGSIEAPFKRPVAAIAQAQPGDTIVFRPGIYAPLEIRKSGTADHPLTLTTLPHETGQAIIDGTGHPEKTGIKIFKQGHLNLSNLTVRNIISASGISIANNSGTVGNIRVEACLIHSIDQSAIRCVGLPPGKYSGTSREIFVENVVLANNEIYDAYRQGAPGNEVITVGGGVRNIITENNDIHDSLQYGIDYKRGVDGGAIRNNRIWNIHKHAIYLDTSFSFVRNISVHGNIAWNCNNGLVLAREARKKSTQILENIYIYNNVFFDMNRFGLMCYAHPGDGPHGKIHNIQMRFNTLYNCNLSGKGLQELRVANWLDPKFLKAGVTRNFAIVGNLLWRDPKRGPPLSYTEGAQSALAQEAGVEIRDNFNAEEKTGLWGILSGSANGENPSFLRIRSRAPASSQGPSHPSVLPDFRLADTSPARGFVEGPIRPPYTYDINGLERKPNASAGAYASP